MRKINFKKIGRISATLLALFIVLDIAGGYYLLHYALVANKSGQHVEAMQREMYAKYPEVGEWLDSLRAADALKDTFLTNIDGIRLHAYYVAAPQPTPKTAVIIHGYTDNAMSMMHIGSMYHRVLQYNILLPDLQYAGFSGGEAIQMGWKDREDVLLWVQAVPMLFGDGAEVVLHGISMGAATVMMLSGDALPSLVKTAIADCGYTSVWDQFEKELKEQFGLPAFPLLHTASFLCQLKYDWNFSEASALRQVSQSSLPILFIHGTVDHYVPTRMVYELYQAKPSPKAIWVSPAQVHAESYKQYPKEYTTRVKEWVERW